MAKIARFEELEAWQLARQLTQQIYIITGAGNFAKDFGLRDQIRRASVSIMANIAEGFERGGNKEFVQFLAVAKGSAGEVRSLLYVAFDAMFITQDQLEVFSAQTQQISRQLGGFMKYLQTTPLRGSKYKS